MLRANSIAVTALTTPYTDPIGRVWGKLYSPSPRACHQTSIEHARTDNELSVFEGGSDWLGLGDQTPQAFDRTGIADYPLALTKKALASLPAVRHIPSAIRPAVSGAVWNIPAVLANLPLSALTRVRAKLAPVNLKFAIRYSANVSPESVAPLAAKLSKAIHDYAQRGGVVTLTLYKFSCTVNPDSYGFISEVRVNANDLAQIALALSPAFSRVVQMTLAKAYSTRNRDSLKVVDDYPEKIIPGAILLEGHGYRMQKAFETAIAILKIT